MDFMGLIMSCLCTATYTCICFENDTLIHVHRRVFTCIHTYMYHTILHLQAYIRYIHTLYTCIYLNRFSLEKKVSGEHYISSMHVVMIGVEFMVAVLNVYSYIGETDSSNYIMYMVPHTVYVIYVH